MRRRIAWDVTERVLSLPAFNVGFHVAGFLGHSSASVLIPNSPAVLDQAIWFQAVGTTTWPFASTLQVSPIAGGVIR